MLAVQAWGRAATAEHGALTAEQKWEAGRQLVTSLGIQGQLRGAWHNERPSQRMQRC